MKKILSLLQQSNLGWLEGGFTCNYSCSDIKQREKEAQDKDAAKYWNTESGGYPKNIRIIFEYKGEIVELFDKEATMDLMKGDGVDDLRILCTVERDKDPIVYLQFFDDYNIDLFFHSDDGECITGTFRAYFPEEVLVLYLNSIFEKTTQ